MSRAGLIIALAVAAVLSVVAYLALKPEPVAPLPASLLGTMDTGRVRTIEISSSTGRRATLSLGGPGNAYWILEWTSPSGTALKWPASATRVRAALRLLAALRTEPGAGPGPVVQPATQIRLIDEGGRTLQLLMSDTPLGGHTSVTAEAVPGIALGEEALASVFAGDLGNWRDPAIFPIDPADASRLELVGGPADLSLARVGKDWAVVEPLAVPSDGPFVAEVLKHLGSTATQRFADETEPRTSASSAARIIVEIDRRAASGDQVRRTTVCQELDIGGPADVGGQTLLCRAAAWILDNDSGSRTDLWGPIAVVIPRTSLEAISTDPDSYISRTATRTASADVRGLDVFVAQSPGNLVDPRFPVGVVRSPSGWQSLKERTSPDPDSSNIADVVLRLLTQDRADAVLSKAPSAYVPVGIISLKDVSGSQLETFEIGLLADPASAQAGLAVKNAMVWRLYKSPGAVSLANWLADRFKK